MAAADGAGRVTSLAFRVYGVAQPQGSARAFMRAGARFPVVTSDNPRNAPWRQLVAAAASDALQQVPDDERAVLAGAVRLSLDFYLPRPKRPRCAAHVTRPDLDKLIRSCNDALTGVVWTDDAQVVELVATKAYADVSDIPHVDVRVEPIAPLPLLRAAERT